MAFDGQGPAGRLKSPGILEGMDRRYFVVLRCLLYLLMGFTMAQGRVLGQGAPLAIALVAATPPSLSGACALVGASLGYLVSGGLEWGIRYIAACVLVYTIAFIFQELSIYRQSFFMPSCTGFVMALTGFLGSFSVTKTTAPMAAQMFLETLIAFGACYFFREALSGNSHKSESAELRYSVSVMISAACLLLSLSSIVILKILSVGRFLAVIVLMSSAMKGGMLTGAAVGTVLGLAMDLSSGGAAFYTMAYSFSGLLAGVFGRHGKVIFVISFIMCSALAVAAAAGEGLYLDSLFETFCACVVFMLLPARFLNQFGLMLQHMEKGSGEFGLRRFVAKRVQNLSEAYAELYDTVRKNVEKPYNDENIARVFDRAADEVCANCKHKNRCWNQEYVDTLSAMNDATKSMIKNGSLSIDDIPEFFREKCEGLPAFVAAVNGELRGLSYRRQLRQRLSENRSIAWGQYMDVAYVLNNVAKELGSINGAEPLCEKRILRYLKSIEVDADASVYRDGGGRLRIVIESGRLSPLLKDPGYLEKLSELVGLRLCTSADVNENTARLCLLEAEPLAVSVGIAALKKKGEAVSGDRGSYFKTDAGVLCVILSDGMGCGNEAAKDSEQVVSILEKFLRSGLDPAVAMKILSSVMLLRSSENWGFATVDLMCVDLFSGETCFYKYGAAPSYVKNGKSIKRIKGESLAAGLSLGEGCAPDIVRMRLQPGSTAVIASDGVIADSNDGWLKELLNKELDDMKLLARTVLKEAEKHYGSSDDMTVVTVRVEERE